jgi:CRP/FNR family transcriptional regulator
MKLLHKLKIQRHCHNCELRSESFFCNLPQSILRNLEALKITNSYPKGAKLFMEGQPSNGIYMLCQGKVKLSTCSKDGKVIILRIAEPGEVLGLSATVSDSPYEATASVLEPCQVNFVRKEDFLCFLQQNSEGSFNAVKQLSRNYNSANIQIRSIGLSHSVAERLARLFLELNKANGDANGCLKMPYTHEEIAEMIGTSRETVTRVLTDFRDKNLITLKGSDLIIHDKDKLEATIYERLLPKTT